jgi:hypothetical protein
MAEQQRQGLTFAKARFLPSPDWPLAWFLSMLHRFQSIWVVLRCGYLFFSGASNFTMHVYKCTDWRSLVRGAWLRAYISAGSSPFQRGRKVRDVGNWTSSECGRRRNEMLLKSASSSTDCFSGFSFLFYYYCGYLSMTDTSQG